MTEKRIDCVVDRAEDGVAVLIPDDGSEIFEVPEDKFRLSENMSCTAIFIDGELTDIVPRKNKTNNRDRLNRLFNKNK